LQIKGHSENSKIHLDLGKAPVAESLVLFVRLGLAVVHRVLLHAHERGIGVGLGVAVAEAHRVQFVFIFLQLLLMLLQLVHGLLALPGLFLVLLGALGEPVVLLVHLVYELLQMLGVYGIRHCPFLLGRGVVLADLLQHTLYLLLQFRLVRQGDLLPDERVLLATDSIFVPSMYCTARLTWPSATIIFTT